MAAPRKNLTSTSSVPMTTLSSSPPSTAGHPSALYPALTTEQFRYFDGEANVWMEIKEDPLRKAVEFVPTLWKAFVNSPHYKLLSRHSTLGSSAFEVAGALFRSNPDFPAKEIIPPVVMSFSSAVTLEPIVPVPFSGALRDALQDFYRLYSRLKKVSSSFPALAAGSASFLGKRIKQEDTHCIGKISHLTFYPQDKAGWDEWFTELFEEIANNIKENRFSGGTTAVVGCFAPDGTCAIGFAGDSSVLEVVDDGEKVTCTKLLEGKLHNATNPAEIKRLTDLNRTIDRKGRLLFEEGSVEFFRNFGNHEVKISHHPDTILLPPPRPHTDSYLVFYTDGMEVLSKKAVEGLFERLRGSPEEDIAVALTELAEAGPNNGDNKTVVVVKRSSRTTPRPHLTGYAGVFDGNGDAGYQVSLQCRDALIICMRKGGPIPKLVNAPRPDSGSCVVM